MARKEPAIKKFYRIVKARLKREFGRDDVLRYFAEKMPTSEAYVSRIINNQTPRRFGDGREMNTWVRFKRHLTEEEIEILEGME